jgi:hypothetical protein
MASMVLGDSTLNSLTPSAHECTLRLKLTYGEDFMLN